MDRKTVLGDIERVYSTLMLLEDHDRKMPPPGDDIEPAVRQLRAEWLMTSST